MDCGNKMYLFALYFTPFSHNFVIHTHQPNLPYRMSATISQMQLFKPLSLGQKLKLPPSASLSPLIPQDCFFLFL